MIPVSTKTHALARPLLAALLFLLAACQSEESKGPAPVERPAQVAEGDAEARLWLRNNPHPYGFAPDRFGYTRGAVDFVERLYNAGADSVMIDGATLRPNDYGEYPAAAALKILLPADEQARENVLGMVNAEWRRQGLPPERDSGPRVVPLSWENVKPPGGSQGAP